eukprot:12084004-Alexandrium_andersonii.AAC.1
MRSTKNWRHPTSAPKSSEINESMSPLATRRGCQLSLRSLPRADWMKAHASESQSSSFSFSISSSDSRTRDSSAAWRRSVQVV